MTEPLERGHGMLGATSYPRNDDGWGRAPPPNPEVVLRGTWEYCKTAGAIDPFLINVDNIHADNKTGFLDLSDYMFGPHQSTVRRTAGDAYNAQGERE